MRNFKRLVASLLATMMVMGVSAFASEPTIAVESTDTTYFESYTGGEVILKSGALTTEGQLTVVIIPADKANATLTDADILYINQGTKADTFWTDGMGTIADFTTLVNADNTSDEYIIRIGGTNIGDSVIEIPMTVTWTAGEEEPEIPTYTLGDVDGVTGINVNDATTVMKHVAGLISLTGDNLLAADVDGVTGINVNDATTIMKYVAGLITEFTSASAN